jgi:hypothetical protein
MHMTSYKLKRPRGELISGPTIPSLAVLYVLLAAAALSVIAAGLKWWKVVKSRPEDDESSLPGAILMTLV